MALKSKLFRGDAKLEAAAVSNPAHITPGATRSWQKRGALADSAYGTRAETSCR